MKSRELKEMKKKYKMYLKEIKKNEKFTLVHPVRLENSFFDLLHENSHGKFITSMYKSDYTAYMYHFARDKFVMNLYQSYFSLNTFISPKRIIKNLFEYTCCFIDLDVYGKGISKYEALFILEEEYFGYSLPIPTYVIDSGYGLYIVWQFTETVPARNKDGFNTKVLNLWNAIQHELYNKLADLGADIKSLDASRVLRNTGTFNTKHGTLKEVEFLRIYNQKYDMRLLADEILPPFEEKAISHDKKTSTENSSTNDAVETKPVKTSNYNVYTTNLNRFIDFRKIVALRNGDFPHKRQMLLFLYRCTLNRLYDMDRSLQLTLELNSKLKYPLSEREVIISTKSANQNERNIKFHKRTNKVNESYIEGYNYTTNKIIELFQISLEEQEYMNTLCSMEIKKMRYNKLKRDKRRNDNGFTTREQNKLNNTFFVHFLRLQGISNQEISIATNIAKGTVSKYLKLGIPRLTEVSSEYIFSNEYLKHLLNENEVIETQSKQAA